MNHSDPSARYRLHPVAALVSALRTARGLLPLVLLSLFTGRSASGLWVLAPLFVGFSLLEGIGSWLRFRYWLEAGEFRVESGFLIRRRSFVPLERIQVVDVSAGVVQRVFGLVRVHVRTAGESGSLELSAVAKTHADWLREALTGAAIEGKVASPSTERRFALSTRELLLLASTSGRFGVLFSGLAWLYSKLDEFVDARAIELVRTVFPRVEDARSPSLIALAVGVCVLAAWFLSFLVELTRYGGFELTRSADQLVISLGLLERRQLAVPVRSIQSVRIVEGLLRQPLGYGAILLDTAAAEGEDKGRLVALHPFVHRARFRVLLGELLPEYEIPSSTHRPPKRALFGFLARSLLGTQLVALGACAAVPGWWQHLPLALAASAALALLIGLRSHRQTAAGASTRVALIRSSLFARTTALVRREHVQAAQLSQSLFALRRGLANFSLSARSGTGARAFAARGLDLTVSAALFDWAKPPRPEPAPAAPGEFSVVAAPSA